MNEGYGRMSAHVAPVRMNCYWGVANQWQQLIHGAQVRKTYLRTMLISFIHLTDIWTLEDSYKLWSSKRGKGRWTLEILYESWKNSILCEFIRNNGAGFQRTFGAQLFIVCGITGITESGKLDPASMECWFPKNGTEVWRFLCLLSNCSRLLSNTNVSLLLGSLDYSASVIIRSPFFLLYQHQPELLGISSTDPLLSTRLNSFRSTASILKD